MSEENDQEDFLKLLEIDPSEIPSPALRRIIEEIKREDDQTVKSYNRFHNRHNRSGYNRYIEPPPGEEG